MRAATVTQLFPRPAIPVSDVQSQRVADVVRTDVVRVPGWFTIGQAHRVAMLKRVSHILVEDRGQVSGAVSATVLASAPATDLVARWAYRTGAQLSPEAPVAAAEQILRSQGVSCLPVVTGGLLVGTVTLHDLPGNDQIDTAVRAA